jgi:hypothetical protein
LTTYNPLPVVLGRPWGRAMIRRLFVRRVLRGRVRRVCWTTSGSTVLRGVGTFRRLTRCARRCFATRTSRRSSAPEETISEI